MARSWVETVPASWERARLRDLVQIANGYALPSAGFNPDDGLPVVRIRDVVRGKTDTYFDGDPNGCPRVDRGDLLIGMDGDFNTAVWPGPKALLNQRVCCLRPRERIEPRFLAYAVPLTLGAINKVTFFTTVKHLSSVDLMREWFPTPSWKEQHAIADFLDRETGRIDRLVEKKRRLIELLEEKRTALISHAVTKGLDPTVPMKDSGIPWLGEIPAHWDTIRLGAFVATELAGTWGDEPQQGSDDIVCLRVADFDRRKAIVSTEKLTMRSVAPDQRLKRRLQPGDILLERSGGGDNQPVGFAVLFDHDFEAVCSNFVSRLRVASDHEPSFVRYVLMAAYAKRLNTRSIKQTTGIQNLDYRNYATELWAAPSRLEQRRIADWIDEKTTLIDHACDKITVQTELLAEYRQALITAAVTGQLDITAEAKDPEEVVA